jgi:excisionase family DNA binding protein
MKTLHTVAEVAAQLGVSKGTIYGLVKQRRVPSHRFGDLVRLDIDEVLAATRIEAQNGDRPCVVQPDAREKHAKIKGKT